MVLVPRCLRAAVLRAVPMHQQPDLVISSVLCNRLPQVPQILTVSDCTQKPLPNKSDTKPARPTLSWGSPFRQIHPACLPDSRFPATCCTFSHGKPVHVHVFVLSPPLSADCSFLPADGITALMATNRLWPCILSMHGMYRPAAAGEIVESLPPALLAPHTSSCAVAS